MDRRKCVNWPMIAIALFMASLGRFALVGSKETLFTNVLASMQMETAWGISMLASSCGVIAAATVIRSRPTRTLLFGIAGIVLLWTWVLVYLIGGIYTPTVEACAWVGTCVIFGTAYDGWQGRVMRCKRREEAQHVLSGD